jgi:hypothetical protein
LALKIMHSNITEWSLQTQRSAEPTLCLHASEEDVSRVPLHANFHPSITMLDNAIYVCTLPYMRQR